MKISLTGRNINISPSLQEYVENRINESLKKLPAIITKTEVVVSKNSHLFQASIIIHETGVGIIKGSSENDDIYSAFDSTLMKLEKQIRKYKDKIVKKHHRATKEFNHMDDEKIITAKKYIFSPSDLHQEEHHDPIIIAEKATDIETLSVSEAVMKMDLSHLPALLFINKANSRLNVVYHRADGNISWVDPSEMQ